MSVPTLLLLLAAAPSSPVDFDTGVLPVLAKAGCNTGACHGAAAGRGGFKLSLFGGDPAADHRAIVAELEGRRVNLAQPERSLLLLKPTWQLDHEGGQRFEADSEFARILTDWIKSGAPRTGKLQVTGLVVNSSADTVDRLPAELSLNVTAQFNDGSTRTITHLAVCTPADPAAIEVSGPGQIRVLRPGRHAIVVRFLTQVQAIQITAPYPNAEITIAPRSPDGGGAGGEGSYNWIDDEINATLIDLRLPPSPPADDAALLRRITLDLTGRLPTPDQVRAFLAADAGSGKFAAEVDRLLASDEFVDFWTNKLADWLRFGDVANDPVAERTYYAWLRHQVGTSRPLDSLATELLTATGDSHVHGPAAFQRATADARSQAEHVAESLLAIRLRCANCHNHPLDRWTQDDYHGLAAIFARVDRSREVRVRFSGEVVHPATGEAAAARIPGQRFLDAKLEDGRSDLAAWLTSRDNPHFARAWANRLWESLLGRGLVHPADDLRETNPATHPALLDRLAADLADHDYDIRHTLRLIANSAVYQRSSKAESKVPDDRFYSRTLRRPLPTPVLVRVICQVTEVPGDSETADKSPTAMRAESRGLSGLDPLGALACTGLRDELGRPLLPSALDQLAGQLQWLNGPFMNRKLSDPRSGFAKLAASSMSTRRLVEEYYLRALSRLPSAEEAKYWQAEIAGTGRAKKCEDFAWSLLSCREFVTNH